VFKIFQNGGMYLIYNKWLKRSDLQAKRQWQQFGSVRY